MCTPSSCRDERDSPRHSLLTQGRSVRRGSRHEGQTEASARGYDDAHRAVDQRQLGVGRLAPDDNRFLYDGLSAADMCRYPGWECPTSPIADLSVHSADDLDWIAEELNDRPRKRLGFRKPIEQIGELFLS
jgi:hypothetical protein